MANHIKIITVAAGLLTGLLATAHAESARDADRRCQRQYYNPYDHSAYEACAARARAVQLQEQFQRCVGYTHNARLCR